MTISPVTQQTTAAIQPQQAKAEPATAEAPAAAKAATAAKAQADSVTLSKQALQLTNSPGYNAGEESTESAAAKASEKSKGQR